MRLALLVITFSVTLGLIGCDAVQPEPPSLVITFDQEPRVDIITGTRARLTWATADTLGGSVRYGRSRSDLSEEVTFASSAGEQSTELASLEPGSEYYFSLELERGSQTGWSDTLSFRTLQLVSGSAADLVSYQRRIVGALTGHTTVGDGVQLGVRSDSASRALAAAYLVAELRALGLDARRHTYSLTSPRQGQGVNPYAIIPATVSTGEHVVVGAHYDTVSRSPGANDNATGVALVLGAAREVLALPRRTKHVVVVLFDEEERGLLGSRAFADSLVEADVNVHSAHTVDQVGWDGDGDRALELELPTPALEFLYRAAAEESTGAPVLLSGVSSTDHRAFRERDIPAIGITEEYANGDTTPHYHRETDTYETVDFEYLAAATTLVAYAWKILVSQ